jgi:L-ribulose-5-phosphate 3-epimerase
MGNDATRRDFLKTSLAGALGAAIGTRPVRAGAQRDIANRLAVCSWSLQPASADDLLARLATTGLTRIQIALDPIRENAKGAWTDFSGLCARKGVTSVSGMIGTVGEDYTTLESIRRTGGVVPDGTWPETWKNIQADAELAQRMGLTLVTFHAGFLPHEESDPSFPKLLARLRQVADLFAAKKIEIGLETGQELAVDALRSLGPWIRQCHLKDAVRTKTPGAWGEEVRLGTGQVDWKSFFRAVDAVAFKGNLCIEREAGAQRAADIRAAREFVERLTVTAPGPARP